MSDEINKSQINLPRQEYSAILESLTWMEPLTAIYIHLKTKEGKIPLSPKPHEIYSQMFPKNPPAIDLTEITPSNDAIFPQNVFSLEIEDKSIREEVEKSSREKLDQWLNNPSPETYLEYLEQISRCGGRIPVMNFIFNDLEQTIRRRIVLVRQKILKPFTDEQRRKEAELIAKTLRNEAYRQRRIAQAYSPDGKSMEDLPQSTKDYYNSYAEYHRNEAYLLCHQAKMFEKLAQELFPGSS